jgi:hypothetical protein
MVFVFLKRRLFPAASARATANNTYTYYIGRAIVRESPKLLTDVVTNSTQDSR